eukprot:6188723-Pyramimonas_sp.AAC.1
MSKMTQQSNARVEASSTSNAPVQLQCYLQRHSHNTQNGCPLFGAACGEGWGCVPWSRLCYKYTETCGEIVHPKTLTGRHFRLECKVGTTVWGTPGPCASTT